MFVAVVLVISACIIKFQMSFKGGSKKTLYRKPSENVLNL